MPGMVVGGRVGARDWGLERSHCCDGKGWGGIPNDPANGGYVLIASSGRIYAQGDCELMLSDRHGGRIHGGTAQARSNSKGRRGRGRRARRRGRGRRSRRMSESDFDKLQSPSWRHGRWVVAASIIPNFSGHVPWCCLMSRPAGDRPCLVGWGRGIVALRHC